jgi:hypothetical protein
MSLFAKRYPVGAVIPIHVNPEALEEAVMDVNPGVSADLMLALVSLAWISTKVCGPNFSEAAAGAGGLRRHA